MRLPAACCCFVCSAWLLGRCYYHFHSCYLQKASIALADHVAHMPGEGRPDPSHRLPCVRKVHGMHVQDQSAATDLVWMSLLLQPASPAALSHKTSIRAARALQPTYGNTLDKGAKPQTCHCSCSDLHRRQ